jgi:hypothetical protein
MVRDGDSPHAPPEPQPQLRLDDLAQPGEQTSGASAPSVDDQVHRARREFAALLGEFRRTAVLVPLDDQQDALAAEFGGIRWILAFSDEESLARYALGRGDGAREWEYRTVLGARLLDVAVPGAGVPCGIALDAGSDDGMLFPPVSGIVPDEAAVV